MSTNFGDYIRDHPRVVGLCTGWFFLTFLFIIIFTVGSGAGLPYDNVPKYLLSGLAIMGVYYVVIKE